jgi:hypothetical protein
VLTKRYKIERRLRGGVFFVCLECPLALNVAEYARQFPRVEGGMHPRTRAAAALNDHAAKEHPKPYVYSESATSCF